MEGVATVLPSCLSGTMSPLNPQLALCQCCGHEGSPGACSVFLLSMLNSSCGDRGACPVNTWVEQWLHFTRDYLSYTPAQYCLTWLGTVPIGHLVGHELGILLIWDLVGFQSSSQPLLSDRHSFSTHEVEVEACTGAC